VEYARRPLSYLSILLDGYLGGGNASRGRQPGVFGRSRFKRGGRNVIRRKILTTFLGAVLKGGFVYVALGII